MMAEVTHRVHSLPIVIRQTGLTKQHKHAWIQRGTGGPDPPEKSRFHMFF